MEGCTNGVAVRGACIKHGAYGMCLIGDCTTMAVNKTQRCKKHGANGLCTVLGCATNAANRGLCTKHGGCTKGVCRHPGCTTKANVRGLCWKHGGSERKLRHAMEESYRRLGRPPLLLTSTMPSHSNLAMHPIVPSPQSHTGSATSTVHLGCAQNQAAPPKW
jgi:hypothetical protein